ncbi:SUMF1/EgtB/PvdO family nonheme iron enzyme [uncultured Desulfobulbus sp.]|uniref:formylglycine-generating enzyme family protein n=1 Tax=uncultured Desulfobulbus sp. TaxID=239745 RepID=UPI0029C63205|nr:SUMF1/EgtB/PvdO family nonheme iron enzyme [uncultured Desulfobulbus sp.]
MMVWVPKGKFWMGSTDAQIAKVLNEAPTLVREWYDNEQPLHTVYLSGYWIYKYEVTVAQYRKFCTKTGRLMPIAPDWRWIDSHPIVNVSWQDASAYAKWAEASLPTEAQWEKAARGTDGRIFPWGNQFDTSKCNESSKELLRTQPVGSYPDGASPYGCMDMAGNAWEYCSDWYSADYYAKSPFRNPTGPKKGIEHSLRGGSWWDNMVNNERCSRRARILPASSDYHSGFRCVRVR